MVIWLLSIGKIDYKLGVVKLIVVRLLAVSVIVIFDKSENVFFEEYFSRKVFVLFLARKAFSVVAG